jgi:hypothetical protein
LLLDEVPLPCRAENKACVNACIDWSGFCDAVPVGALEEVVSAGVTPMLVSA